MMLSRSSLLRLCAASVLVTALAGCGGGGGDSTAALASTTRLLQPGDSWSYRVEYSNKNLGGVARSYTETVLSREASGEIAYRIEAKGDIATSVVEQQLSQEGDGAPIYLRGNRRFDLNGTSEVQNRLFAQYPELGNLTNVPGSVAYPTNYVLQPGIWGSGYAWSYLRTLDPSGQRDPSAVLTVTPITDPGVPDRDFRIVGTETVTTPAGRFETWKVRQTQSAGTPDATVSTIWYAPQIGNFVKWKADLVNPTNPQPSYEMVLTSTTVKTR